MQTNKLILYENRNSKSILLKNFIPILIIIAVMVTLVEHLSVQMKFVLHVLHNNDSDHHHSDHFLLQCFRKIWQLLIWISALLMDHLVTVMLSKLVDSKIK